MSDIEFTGTGAIRALGAWNMLASDQRLPSDRWCDAPLRTLPAFRPTAARPRSSASAAVSTPVPAPSPSTNGQDPPAVPLRVAIVAEVCLYREGIASSLARRRETEVIATAGRRTDALDLVRRTRPDVLLLDLGTPGAAEIIREARDTTRVVALAITDTVDGVLACAEAGVYGYVTSDASVGELVSTLQAVARGELMCPPSISASLFRHVG
ncbi:MAG TPA: response regulator transcription factor, partial [Longimicrobiaceae bacterium]|nr:response regulator transcription factor [Longimicrobiaceae bacterium]